MIKTNSFFHHAFSGRGKSYVETAETEKGLINFSGGEVHLAQNRAADLAGYPDPACRELKRVIAKRFGVSETMIAVGNGSDEIIENIPRVFLEPGDPCLFVVPTFFRFIESCRKMKAKIITVATEEKDGFLVTPTVLVKIKAEIRKHRPKIIWLDSPNSVSGTVIPITLIKEILSVANGLVVIDEVHHELIDPENKKSATALLSKHENLIILRSASKAFGLAGIRFGFGLTDPKIAAGLERWRLLFTVNTFAQKAVIAAFSDTTRLIKVTEDVGRLRKMVLSSIPQIPGFVIGADSQTHLFLLKHKNFDLFETLRHHGILAADLRQAPGLEGKGYVRLNIKTPKETMLLLNTLRIIYNQEIRGHEH